MLGGKPSVDLLILPCLDEEIEQWSYFVFCDDACLDSLVTGKCSNNQAIVPLWCCLKACWLHIRTERSIKPAPVHDVTSAVMQLMMMHGSSPAHG